MKLSDRIARIQAKHEALMQRPVLDRAALEHLEREVHSLLNAYPEEPVLSFLLGVLYSQTDRAGAAVVLLESAQARGLDSPDLLNNLAAAYKVEHKDATAAKCYEKSIEKSQQIQRRNAKRIRNGKPPDVPPELVQRTLANALHGMSGLYINAGLPEKCIAWADEALKLNPEDRYAQWNRGIGCLEAGRWKEGWEAYDVAGFAVGDGGKPLERKLKTYGGLPKWDGTPGKTVICYGEQGIGDEVMLASMLPDLMHDCRVIIDCDARLETLFRRSFPDAEAIYATSGIDDPFPWIVNHKVDAWVPMGSLGRHYRPDAVSFPRTPYLKADEARIVKWRNILDEPNRNLRVGISWAGGLKKTRFDQRTIRLERWAEILKVPGVDWYSLQYHPHAAQEAADVGRQIGVPIHHYGDVIADYDETAAFLGVLDLVITVNTSLLHLAGSLGVRTWCLTPKMCAWRYQCEGPNPFYGSVEMVRQRESGDWAPILRSVAATLRAEVGQREAA